MDRAGEQPGLAGAARSVRVFVSSTFVDMNDEREELVKRTFPALRDLCESRGVTWGEVDLRWGIATEQQARGEILPICFAEIQGCRPYFLGILGERYGWVPDRIEASLAESEPWLGEQVGSSVTELEIIHGVLRVPEMADSAFFYFRDPQWAARDSMFLEQPTPGEVLELGAAVAERQAQRRREKLAALKDRIRASGLPVRDGYRDPKHLGELVLADLTAMIERRFPKGSQPTRAQREHDFHEEFARARTPVYVSRPRDLETLDRHATGGGPPLVVVGDSGVGKSALLANWATRWRGRATDCPVLMHFIAASPESRDWVGMLQRMIAELAARGEVDMDTVDDSKELPAAFQLALNAAARRGPFVLLIDALDQLEDRDGAPDLVWLPDDLPQGARLILSTLPGRALTQARRRGYITHEVRPLQRREREQLIAAYLGQFAKRLSAANVRRIAAARATANPLFLRSLLEELRVYGDHQTLDDRVSELLTAGGRRGRPAEAIPKLYDLILTRWEDDYDGECPELVADVMTAVHAARRGLAEAELVELLGEAGEPLPHAFLSPLRLAAKQAVTDHSGLLTFTHDYVRQAVAQRYLDEAGSADRAHARLGRYFGDRPLTAQRTLDELPWQLREAGAWDELYKVLADARFSDALAEEREYELTGYWLELDRNATARSAQRGGQVLGVAEAYQAVIRHPAGHSPARVDRIARLLGETGHDQQALRLYEYLGRSNFERDERAQLQSVLGRSANILRRQGDLDAAYELYTAQELVCREIGHEHGLQAAVGGQARVLLARGDLDGALSLSREREAACERIDDREGRVESIGDQAVALRLRGDLDAALTRYVAQEDVARRLGSPRLVAGALAGQASILVGRGRLRRAEPKLAAWRQVWWEFANDADRRRWRLGVTLTAANRRVLLYLTLAIVLVTGCVPIGIAIYQIATVIGSGGLNLTAMAWIFLTIVLAIVAAVVQTIVLRVRLVRARRDYATLALGSEVGNRESSTPSRLLREAFQADTPRAPSPEIVLGPFGLNPRAFAATRVGLVLGLLCLVSGTALSAVALHHVLGSTLPCSDVTFRTDCYTNLGWYLAMMGGGVVLAVVAGAMIEPYVVFPIYVGVTGAVICLTGLGVPLLGLKKWSLVVFGGCAVIAGLALGLVFWATGRR